MTLTPYKIDLSMYEGEVRRVVSEAVQKKAWNLGYPGWTSNGTKVVNTEEPWLTFNEKGTWFSSNRKVNYEPVPTYISAADFLALTTAKDKPKRKDGWYWARLSGATEKLIVEYKNECFAIPDAEGSTCNDAVFAWIAEDPIPEPIENEEATK